jgi:hypothetical protein
MDLMYWRQRHYYVESFYATHKALSKAIQIFAFTHDQIKNNSIGGNYLTIQSSSPKEHPEDED